MNRKSCFGEESFLTPLLTQESLYFNFSIIIIMSDQAKQSPAKKAKKPVKYVKDPSAPKRFKSAFIFFTMDRHRILREKFEESRGRGDNTPDVAKLISEEWKALAPEERAKWDEKARLDKERYEVEKALYTGPWKIPAKKKSKKDATAPKRPMSSFLSFSNSNRGKVKEDNPGITNAQASKILAKMWKEASEEEKREHIEREEQLREVYKKEMAEWRAKKEEEDTKIREKREEEAMDVVTGKKAFPLDRIALYTGTTFAAAKKANEEKSKANDAAGETEKGDNDNDAKNGDDKYQPPPPITPIQATAAAASATVAATAHQTYFGQHHLYGYAPHFPYQPSVMVTPHSAQANRSSAASAAAAAAAAPGSSPGQPTPTGYAYPGYNYGAPTPGAYYAHHYPYAQYPPYGQYPPQQPPGQQEGKDDEDQKPSAI